jgi:predicted phage terminase large subunit-like protein
MNTLISPDDFRFILRHDLMSFIERSFTELNPQASFMSSPYLEVIATKLELVRQGRIRRLIVNLPPRSLKSHSICVAFVAWILGHSPEAQIICASYGQELAEKHARDCRTLMASQFYRDLFPATRLAPERLALNDFATTAKGFRMSTSVGGVLTGRGGDFIILDDPLKPEQALSETQRKAANDWYDNTLLSRLNSKEKGVIIIVMQRLHQDDLVGHVLEQGKWDVLSFPAIAEEDESCVIESPLGIRKYERRAGEALHPERESLQTLQETRRSIEDYIFFSQYQQNPIPLEGALIKREWIQYYEQQPERFTMILQSWDTANKSGELNNFSVCTTWGVWKGKWHLLDVYRRRLEYPELKRAIRDQSKLFRSPTPIVLIEDKASGTQLIQELKREGVLRIKEYEPPSGTDKIMRLVSQSAHFESGKCTARCFVPDGLLV